MTDKIAAFNAAMARQNLDDAAALKRATAYRQAWDTALAAIDLPGITPDKKRLATAIIRLTSRQDEIPAWQPDSIPDPAVSDAMAVMHESWTEFGLPVHRSISKDWLRLVAAARVTGH